MQVIIVGGEDGSLRILDLRTDQVQSAVQAHGMRVRGVAALSAGEASGSEPAHLVGSAATDGFIRLWDLRSTGAAAAFLPCSVVANDTCFTSQKRTHISVQGMVECLCECLRKIEICCAGSAGSSQAQPLCEASTSARLTCLTVLQPGKKAPASLAVPSQRTATATDNGSKAAAEPKQARKRRKEEADEQVAAQDVRREPQKVQEKAKVKKASKVEAVGEEGVVVRRQAETVVEFPDEAPKKKKKSTAKAEKGK